MWSEVLTVQEVAWRMLHRLRSEGWPQDLLNMLNLDNETLVWAKAEAEDETTEESSKHINCNGTELSGRDTVLLIKDLNVKGTCFTAKGEPPSAIFRLYPTMRNKLKGELTGSTL